MTGRWRSTPRSGSSQLICTTGTRRRSGEGGAEGRRDPPAPTGDRVAAPLRGYRMTDTPIQGRETTLGQFQMKLRELIKLDGRPVKPLGACTIITAERARNHAAKEINAYKARMRLEAEARGEKELASITRALKGGRKPAPVNPPPSCRPSLADGHKKTRLPHWDSDGPNEPRLVA